MIVARCVYRLAISGPLKIVRWFVEFLREIGRCWYVDYGRLFYLSNHFNQKRFFMRKSTPFNTKFVLVGNEPRNSHNTTEIQHRRNQHTNNNNNKRPVRLCTVAKKQFFHQKIVNWFIYFVLKWLFSCGAHLCANKARKRKLGTQQNDVYRCVTTKCKWFFKLKIPLKWHGTKTAFE